MLLWKLTGNTLYREDLEATFNDVWLPGGELSYTPGGLAWRIQWGSNRYAGNFKSLVLKYIFVFMWILNGIPSFHYDDVPAEVVTCYYLYIMGWNWKGSKCCWIKKWKEPVHIHSLPCIVCSSYDRFMLHFLSLLLCKYIVTCNWTQLFYGICCKHKLDILSF